MLALSKSIGNPLNEASSLCNIGLIYSDKGKLDDALNYYQQTLAINKALGNPLIQASALNNIGNVYKRTGKLDLALNCCQQALIIFKTIGAGIQVRKTEISIKEINQKKLQKNRVNTYLGYKHLHAFESWKILRKKRIFAKKQWSYRRGTSRSITIFIGSLYA